MAGIVYQQGFGFYYKFCTCGHMEKIREKNSFSVKKICSKCKDNLDYINSMPSSIIDVEKVEITDKTFHIKKHFRSIYKNNNEYCLSDETIYELEFDAEKPNNYIIHINNVLAKNNIKNLKLCLTNVFICKKWNNTIFENVGNLFNTDSLNTIVFKLIEYPHLEIFYNTYKNLKYFKHLNLNRLKKATTPSEIVNMPKSIWNKTFEILKNSIDNFNPIPNDFIDNIYYLIECFPNKIDYVVSILNSVQKINISKFDTLIVLLEEGYELNRLTDYLTDDIYRFQGISKPKEGITILNDYVSMCKQMNVEYEKYPKSLKLKHDLALMNFNIVIEEIKNEEFKKVASAKEYKYYEYKDIQYSVIAPTCCEDVINEGKQLSHCVSSYIDNIKKKETKILFMRETNNLNKSLLTLEVKNGILNQYSGFGNRKPTDEELKFLFKYIKVKNLGINEKKL